MTQPNPYESPQTISPLAEEILLAPSTIPLSSAVEQVHVASLNRGYGFSMLVVLLMILSWASAMAFVLLSNLPGEDQTHFIFNVLLWLFPILASLQLAACWCFIRSTWERRGVLRLFFAGAFLASGVCTIWLRLWHIDLLPNAIDFSREPVAPFSTWESWGFLFFSFGWLSLLVAQQIRAPDPRLRIAAVCMFGNSVLLAAGIAAICFSMWGYQAYQILRLYYIPYFKPYDVVFQLTLGSVGLASLINYVILLYRWRRLLHAPWPRKK